MENRELRAKRWWACFLKAEDDGSTLVEFALVIPWALLTITMILEIGTMIQARFALNQAAYAAARRGALANGQSQAMISTIACELAPATQGVPELQEMGWIIPPPVGILPEKNYRLVVRSYAAAMLFSPLASQALYAQSPYPDPLPTEPINRVLLLNAPPQPHEAIRLENGKMGKGRSYLADDVAALRLEVELIHRRKMLFPYLKAILLGASAVTGESLPEDDRRALQHGWLTLRTRSTWRMQSNWAAEGATRIGK